MRADANRNVLIVARFENDGQRYNEAKRNDDADQQPFRQYRSEL